MLQDDIIQIRIGKYKIGIAGLNEVMKDTARDFAESPESEVQEELLRRLSEKNYIPEGARKMYGKAFVREFKRFLGKLLDDEDATGSIEVKVLGPGCAQCDRLLKELMEAMTEINLAADVEHVTDIREIGKYGVVGTPALIINGEVKSVGIVPPKSKIIRWLREIQDGEPIERG